MQRTINPYTFREERPCVEDGAGVVASLGDDAAKFFTVVPLAEGRDSSIAL